jgi:hypothetical protein
MRPDAKAESLAALREIFDGAWTRRLGTDGGRELQWKGKVGLIFASTGVIDAHYSVIGAMGDRFLFCRLAPADAKQFRKAIKHLGDDTGRMRAELRQAARTHNTTTTMRDCRMPLEPLNEGTARPARSRARPVSPPGEPRRPYSERPAKSRTTRNDRTPGVVAPTNSKGTNHA